MKRRIGISYSEINFINYRTWFTENDLGNDVELIDLSFEKNNTEDIATCSGFVLSGGIDVDPSFYNGSTDYPNRPSSFFTDRDRFEEKIFRYSQEHKLPLLAICRGLQLVNVLCDGTLVQDLGNETGNKVHKGNPDKIHPVSVEKNSLLYALTQTEKGEVNSAHHQAINKLGTGLVINSRAADGTIEGIEWADKSDKAFMLAVQWHPERMSNKESNPLSEKLKETFLKSVRNFTTDYTD